MVMELKKLFVKYIKLREKLDNGKIYKIIDNTNNNVYIGSTCKTLKNRLSHHKSNYKQFLKGLYGYNTSYNLIKNNDYKIELLEACNIKTKQELFEREKYYIQNNECINKVVPGRNKKEYREANKDKIKDYYITNKDKIIEYKKQYRIDNKDKNNENFECECGGKYTRCHKSHHFKSTKHQEFIKVNN